MTKPIHVGEFTLTRDRPGSAYPWTVRHNPSGWTTTDTSQANARTYIRNGWYARRIALAFRPALPPGARRDWHRDPITRVWHLYTGGIASWHCDLHGRTCSPITPITGEDLLRMAAQDPAVDDDMFCVLARVVDNQPIA